jgi:hypothetical protein
LLDSLVDYFLARFFDGLYWLLRCYWRGHEAKEDYMPSWYKEQQCFWCHKVLPAPRQSLKIEVEVLEEF